LPKKNRCILKRGKNNTVAFSPRDARAPHDNLTFDLIYSEVSPCILEASIEWVTQRNLAELNADAAFTSLPVTVGGNVHIITGKRLLTNKQDRKIFRSA
jgi:hypothetical protein